MLFPRTRLILNAQARLLTHCFSRLHLTLTLVFGLKINLLSLIKPYVQLTNKNTTLLRPVKQGLQH